MNAVLSHILQRAATLSNYFFICHIIFLHVAIKTGLLKFSLPQIQMKLKDSLLLTRKEMKSLKKGSKVYFFIGEVRCVGVLSTLTKLTLSVS